MKNHSPQVVSRNEVANSPTGALTADTNSLQGVVGAHSAEVGKVVGSTPSVDIKDRYLEWKICVNCKKKFPRRIKFGSCIGSRKKKALEGNIEIRGSIMKTCSKKCSRIISYHHGQQTKSLADEKRGARSGLVENRNKPVGTMER